MVYKLINFLGMLLLANSLCIPAKATLVPEDLVSEDLVYQTVKQLEQSLFNELNEPTFVHVPCLGLRFNSPTGPKNLIKTNDLRGASNKSSASSESNIAVFSTTDATRSKRSLNDRMSGGFIFRVEQKNAAGDSLISAEEKLKDGLHEVADAFEDRLRIPTQRNAKKLNGTFIFRITEVSEIASTNKIEIDPVLLPNYQLEQDAYWQYYADCDQWNIVFNQEMGLQSNGFAEIQQVNETGPILHQSLATVTATRTLIAQNLLRLAHGSGKWIQSRFMQVHHWSHALAIVENQNFSEVETDRKQVTPHRKIEMHAKTKPLPTVTQMLIHQLLSEEMLFSPQRCLNQCLHSLHRTYGETLVGCGIGEFVRRINQKHKIDQNNKVKEQIKLTQGFARRLNWLAFQLHRAAVAVDDCAEEQLESVAESEQSVHY